MKKIYLLAPAVATALTLSPSLLFANPPSFLGYIDATIGVKNNTNDSIDVSCRVGVTNQGNYTLGGPQTITQGGAYTFTGTAGDGCSVSMQGSVSNGDTNVVCDYTDTTTGHTGTFTLGACQNASTWSIGTPVTYSNNIYVAENGTPPTPYNCAANSANYFTTSETFTCSSGNTSVTSSTCKVEAYFAVCADTADNKTYHFTWDDIDLTPTKGQRMADKLAQELAQNGNYGKVTAAYSHTNQQIAITLPPADSASPNPYDDMTSVGQCRNACVPS